MYIHIYTYIYIHIYIYYTDKAKDRHDIIIKFNKYCRILQNTPYPGSLYYHKIIGILQNH